MIICFVDPTDGKKASRRLHYFGEHVKITL